ncbi:MAG TPA: hypothetical protein VK842_04310 [bacterium]|jgi:Spy/CpxP family protein refolding chaperone|nr:hypothetical protein [bacterium]
MNTKFLTKSVAFACLGLLLSAPALRADEGKDGKGGPEAQARMLDKMKVDLDLTDSQVSKVKAENADDMAAEKMLRDKMMLNVDKLRLLVDNKAGADELNASIAMIKGNKADMDAQKAKHMDAMQEILTPMQQAKGILMMVEHMKHEMGVDGVKDGGK